MACQYPLPKLHSGPAFSRGDAACAALALAVAVSVACGGEGGGRSTPTLLGSPTSEGSPFVTVEPVSPTPAPAGFGVIEGSFRYPSSGIPPTLVACAERVDGGETFCTAEHLYGPRFVSGQG